MVDLPGLIHSATKAQSDADVSLVHSLVQDYVENERTVILAVLSAKNDLANQIVVKKVQEVDPSGSRTLGIITKPDTLTPGSSNESTWIDVALNNNVVFELGWHMLRNRGEDDNISFEERNAAEDKFFSTGTYAGKLSPDSLGVGTLRPRLAGLLNDHLKKEMPGLRRELEEKLAITTSAIEKLGQKRTTIQEEKKFLMKISSDVNNIIRAAVDGNYDLDFFGQVDLDADIDDISNIKRFRAAVQYMNLDFAQQMRLSGKKYNFSKAAAPGNPESDRTGTDDLESSEEGSEKPDGDCADRSRYGSGNQRGPIQLTKNEALDWVSDILRRSRGRELPGTFNPLLITQLFKEQSECWEAMANAHIARVYRKCMDFTQLVLRHVAPADTAKLISTRTVAALEASFVAAKEELAKLIKDKKGHPSTYNHYFTTTVQRGRKRTLAEVADVQARVATPAPAAPAFGKVTFGAPAITTSTIFNPNLNLPSHGSRKRATEDIELNMDRLAADEALRCTKAYYKSALKLFIENVTQQVVERHLVGTLADSVIPPLQVVDLDDSEIHRIAGEPLQLARQRKLMEQRKEMLEAGRATFKKALGELY